MKDQVLLVGAFQEAIELCELCNLKIVGIFDNKNKGEFFGCEILGDDAAAATASDSMKQIPVVLTPDQPVVRKTLADYYAASGYKFRSLISPEASISKSVKLGLAVFIQSGCNVSAAVQLGDFVRLNTSANIMHDTRIGNFATVAPNAVILGKVTIGAHCYIGANSTILPGLNVQPHSVVGAGAVVTHGVTAHTTVVGVPAHRLVKL